MKRNNITLQFDDVYGIVNKEKIEKLWIVLNENFNFKTEQMVDISIVTNSQIKKLNKQYRQINKPTDVLSFASKNKFPHDNLLGSVFISNEEWKKHLNEYQKLTHVNLNEKDKIITLLIIHGFLHLIGFDHTNKTQENKMFTLQDKLLKELWSN